MSEPQFVVKMNFNRIDLATWIDKTRQPDGSYRLVGMGRRTEFDTDTGAVVSDKTEPTGLTGTAPHDAFGEPRTFRQWLHSVMHNVPHEGPARASCAGPLDAVVGGQEES